jgi:hypothetical protein
MSGDSFTLNVETDMILGESAVFMNVTISRAAFGAWKNDNPTGTMDDFILQKIKGEYELYAKSITKAQSLVNKPFTW